MCHIDIVHLRLTYLEVIIHNRSHLYEVILSIGKGTSAGCSCQILQASHCCMGCCYHQYGLLLILAKPSSDLRHGSSGYLCAAYTHAAWGAVYLGPFKLGQVVTAWLNVKHSAVTVYYSLQQGGWVGGGGGKVRGSGVGEGIGVGKGAKAASFRSL
jgi:hypothetical protein